MTFCPVIGMDWAARALRNVRQRLAAACLLAATPLLAAAAPPFSDPLGHAFEPPAYLTNQFGSYRSLLQFNDGQPVRTAADWAKRRQEIVRDWTQVLGPWPPLLAQPRMEFIDQTTRDNFVQHRVRVELAAGQWTAGYLLVPQGTGPFPAVLVPFYEPETSVGLGKAELRDFGYQLARRGFVTLSIGSPGGDARLPELGAAQCQPLSFLAYIAANGHTVLAHSKEVDPAKIGIVGHSYGGKWALFGACFYEKFACGVWSDPGIVFDESRPNVNYWEPWYLGKDAARPRTPGLPTPQNPTTGAYRALLAAGHDLPEVLSLMAPRPFLVSGGSEDPPERWLALNRVMEVYAVLGAAHRVAMTSRPNHNPTSESNEQIYRFFERFLKPGPAQRP